MNILELNKNNYISKNETPSDLRYFALTNLSEHKWFMDNVKEFICLDKEDGSQDIIKL